VSRVSSCLGAECVQPDWWDQRFVGRTSGLASIHPSGLSAKAAMQEQQRCNPISHLTCSPTAHDLTIATPSLANPPVCRDSHCTRAFEAQTRHSRSLAASYRNYVGRCTAKKQVWGLCSPTRKPRQQRQRRTHHPQPNFRPSHQLPPCTLGPAPSPRMPSSPI